MIDLNNMVCCGVKEIGSLGLMVARRQMRQVVKEVWTMEGRYPQGRPRCAHVVFTAVQPLYEGQLDYGEKFRAYIERYKLGTVVASEAAVNPNTHNKVKVYIWTLDMDRMRKFLKIEEAEDDQRESA